MIHDQRISRRSFLVFGAIAPAFVVAACGSDSSSSDTAAAPAPPEPPTTGAAATDPAATDPAATDPAATDPAATDPAATDPAPDSAETDPSATAAATAGVTGTLNFLNFTGWAGPTTYADFAKAFPGATVNEIAWTSSDDTISKAKDRAGDIDVVLVDGTTFPRLTAINVLGTLGEIPNLKFVADQYKSTAWDPANERFAATDHGRTGFCYRKDLV